MYRIMRYNFGLSRNADYLGFFTVSLLEDKRSRCSEPRVISVFEDVWYLSDGWGEKGAVMVRTLLDRACQASRAAPRKRDGSGV